MHPSLASDRAPGRNWGRPADVFRPGQEVIVVRKPVVLITGASGEIGHGLIERLAREGERPILTLDLKPLEPEHASKVQRQFTGSDPRRQPARADPVGVRGRPRLPPRGAPLDARRVHAHHRAPGERRGHAADAGVRAEGGRVARAARRLPLPELDRRLRHARPRGEGARGEGARGRLERPHHDVRLQQALLRAPRALLRPALQAARGGAARGQGRLPLRPLPRPHLGRHGALRRHLRLRAGDAARGRPGQALRLLRPARHAHPVHDDARRRRGAARAGGGADGEAHANGLQRRRLQPLRRGDPRARARTRFPGAEVTWAPHLKRQQIVDSWPADVDDSAARRDWGFAPRYDEARAFSEYLIPTIRERYR